MSRNKRKRNKSVQRIIGKLDVPYFQNKNRSSILPFYNIYLDKIVLGCNYHFRGQSQATMRFVLTEVKGKRARLQTRVTKSDFWVDLDKLVFITSEHNLRKASKLRDHRPPNKEEIEAHLKKFGELLIKH